MNSITLVLLVLPLLVEAVYLEVWELLMSEIKQLNMLRMLLSYALKVKLLILKLIDIIIWIKLLMVSIIGIVLHQYKELMKQVVYQEQVLTLLICIHIVCHLKEEYYLAQIKNLKLFQEIWYGLKNLQFLLIILKLLIMVIQMMCITQLYIQEMESMLMQVMNILIQEKILLYLNFIVGIILCAFVDIKC